MLVRAVTNSSGIEIAPRTVPQIVMNKLLIIFVIDQINHSFKCNNFCQQAFGIYLMKVS